MNILYIYFLGSVPLILIVSACAMTPPCVQHKVTALIARNFQDSTHSNHLPTHFLSKGKAQPTVPSQGLKTLFSHSSPESVTYSSCSLALLWSSFSFALLCPFPLWAVLNCKGSLRLCFILCNLLACSPIYGLDYDQSLTFSASTWVFIYRVAAGVMTFLG